MCIKSLLIRLFGPVPAPSAEAALAKQKAQATWELKRIGGTDLHPLTRDLRAIEAEIDEEGAEQAAAS